MKKQHSITRAKNQGNTKLYYTQTHIMAPQKAWNYIN